MASNASNSSGHWPSLLDRLNNSGTDELPIATATRAGSLARSTAQSLPDNQYRDSLARDLACLLNACALSASRDLTRWPNVARSVLNFGVPGFTGRTLTNADVPEIQRSIQRAIQNFEPRLNPKSIKVFVFADLPDKPTTHWQVTIIAQYSNATLPGSLEFQAVIDAESGLISMAAP